MNNEENKLNEHTLFDLVLFALQTRKLKGTLDSSIASIESRTNKHGQRILILELTDKEFSFSLPANRLYQYYKEAGYNLTSLLEGLMAAVKNHIAEFNTLNPMEILSNLSVDNFYIQVLPWKGNETYLEGKIHFPIPVDNSLRAVLRYFINVSDDNVTSFVVDKETFDALPSDIQNTLFERSKNNTLKLFPMKCSRMVDSLVSALKLHGLNQYQINSYLQNISEHEYLYRISTSYNLYGSNALLFTDEIAAIAQRLGNSVFVLPASKDEVFVASTRSKMNALQWLETIKDANQTFNQSEWLSDNLYIYHLATNTMQMIDANNIK